MYLCKLKYSISQIFLIVSLIFFYNFLNYVIYIYIVFLSLYTDLCNVICINRTSVLYSQTCAHVYVVNSKIYKKYTKIFGFFFLDNGKSKNTFVIK